MSDITPPTVSFSDNIAGVAAAGSIVTYTLSFSEPVTGLDASDFAVTNGTVGAVSGSGANWSVSVTPLANLASGTLGLTLKAGAVVDSSGNPNAQASDSSQAIDTLAPAAPRLVTSTAFKSVLDPQITLHTSAGNVLLELASSQAPVTVADVLAYVNDGFYSNTLFHRVIDGFMVQGGGLTPDMVPKTPTYAPIPLESNNGLQNLRGTVAMARTSAPDSATSQFYINLVDNGFLDYAGSASPGYAVFGKVVTGMAVIDGIATVPTGTVNGYADVPLTPVVINSVEQTVVGRTISNTGTFAVAGLESGGHFDYSLDGGTHWLTGAGSSFTVPAGNYAAGSIEVRQFDAAGNQSAAVGRFLDTLNVSPSNNVSANHAPTGGVYVLGTATLGQALHADLTTLADADGAGTLTTPSFQWLRAGEYIAGATLSTYTLVASDVGAPISLRITYTDALGRVESVMSSGNGLQGDANANVLVGSDYNDLLQGNAGNDTLNGGLGADTLVGGLGNDVFIVDNVNDLPVENAGEGVDEVRSSVSYPYLLGTNIENLTLTGSVGNYAIGNELANLITGNSGANMLVGLAGNDTLNGGAGTDTVYYLNDPAGVRVNLAQGTATDGWGAQDSLVSIEDVAGSNYDDTLIGDGGNNYLRGYVGNDVLSGAAGNDTLDGGDGVDEATFAAMRASYTVTKTSTGYLVTDNVGTDGTDTLLNIERLVFSDVAVAPSKPVDLLVYSWKAHTLLDGVSVTAANHAATTAASGAGTLSDVTEASLSLSANRVVPAAETSATSSAVNLQDAIAILKMIVGLDVNGTGKPLSPYQALAADFDGNGQVQLTDAIGVLKHVVGLSAPDPVWHFVNEASTAVTAITAQPLQPGQPPAVQVNTTVAASPVHVGLVAYLSGDVDGSFAGVAGAQTLDASYFQNLHATAGVDLSQFGLYA